MLRWSLRRAVAPWVPPAMSDTKTTVPPPPCGEVGGTYGVSIRYSHRIATTPHWQRMANSTYAERMEENATYYPFRGPDSDEYSIRYLPRPYPDPVRNRPMFEVGEHRKRLPNRIPVIFLVDLFDQENNAYYGKQFETVYVSSNFAREELLPARYAVYATPEAYALLGLPVVDHRIHAVIPKNKGDVTKIAERRTWDEERWKFTIDYLFRKYHDGPPELMDMEVEWDGSEELGGGAGGAAAASGSARKGPIKQRKARKIKLF